MNLFTFQCAEPSCTSTLSTPVILKTIHGPPPLQQRFDSGDINSRARYSKFQRNTLSFTSATSLITSSTRFASTDNLEKLTIASR